MRRVKLGGHVRDTMHGWLSVDVCQRRKITKGGDVKAEKRRIRVS
jgi:hypothetical protein